MLIQELTLTVFAVRALHLRFMGHKKLIRFEYIKLHI